MEEERHRKKIAKWSMWHVMHTIAGGDFLCYDEATKQNYIFCLNCLAYLKENEIEMNK